MELEVQYKIVIESLKLLSASYEEQRKSLPEFADVPDDVTSSFENAFLLLPQLIEEGRFSNEGIASLLRVFNKMEWCLRNIELDDFSNSEWNKLRELSKQTLILLDEDNNMTDLDYV